MKTQFFITMLRHFFIKNRAFNFISLLAIVVCIFSSCNDNAEKDKAAADAIKAAEIAQREAAKQPVLAEQDEVFPTDHIVAKGPATTIDFFGKQSHNFGKITQGEKTEHDFEFKNTGKNPLTIINCKATCGCTVPDWQKTPIMPSEKSKIHVVFNSEGKIGQQNKAITITANTEPQQTVITMVGMVETKH